LSSGRLGPPLSQPGKDALGSWHATVKSTGRLDLPNRGEGRAQLEALVKPSSCHGIVVNYKWTCQQAGL
jgi:hypothetical protein